MPIKINSTGGGSVSIDVPSTGGTYTLTAPANNATIFTTAGGAITGNVAVTGVASFSSNVTFTSNNVTIGGNAISPYSGMRNRIINGGMLIDQRNAGANSTSISVYTVDRYYFGATQSSKGTWGQNLNSITPPPGFSKYLGWQTASSSYSIGAGDIFNFYQTIEGNNFYDLSFGTSSAKTVTLSFWVRCSLTGTFGGALVNYASDRCYPFSYTINSANTWEYKTITIPGDTSGTWAGATNSGAAILLLGFACGATYAGTAGAWTSSTVYNASGTTSVLGTANATWYITGIQLEAGSVATPFEFRPYGTELALCQRYYEVLYYDAGNAAVIGTYYTSSNYWTYWHFKQQKRASPTVALVTGAWQNWAATIYPSVSGASFQYTGASSGYAGGSTGNIALSAVAEI